MPQWSTPRGVETLAHLVICIAMLGSCGPRPEPAVEADADQEDTEATDARLDSPDDVVGATEFSMPELHSCAYPHSGYGHERHEVLEPFWLRSCSGEAFNFPSLLCDNELLTIHLSAGWCNACAPAAEAFREHVAAPLGGEPVAFVELLFEGSHGVAATLEDCERWTRNYPDSNVITLVPSTEGIVGPLGRLVDAGPVPSTIVIDSSGAIQLWRRLAVPEYLEVDMDSLHSEIEEILNESP